MWGGLAAPQVQGASAPNLRGEPGARVPALAPVAGDLHVVGHDVGRDEIRPIRRVHAIDGMLVELGENLAEAAAAGQTHGIAVVVSGRRKAGGGGGRKVGDGDALCIYIFGKICLHC